MGVEKDDPEQVLTWAEKMGDTINAAYVKTSNPDPFPKVIEKLYLLAGQTMISHGVKVDKDQVLKEGELKKLFTSDVADAYMKSTYSFFK
jgi:hypothetical protein